MCSLCNHKMNFVRKSQDNSSLRHGVGSLRIFYITYFGVLIELLQLRTMSEWH